MTPNLQTWRTVVVRKNFFLIKYFLKIKLLRHILNYCLNLQLQKPKFSVVFHLRVIHNVIWYIFKLA